MTAESTSSYFDLVGPGRYRPTWHAGGAWADDELHMAPVSGAILDAVQRVCADRPGPPLTVSRISFDILGKLPAAEFEVQVRTIRPGRTIELLEATLVSGGRTAVLARIWMLSDQDTAAAAGGGPDPLPHPDGLPGRTFNQVWSGGFVNSLQLRPCGPSEPGRAQVWLGTDLDLVAGQPVSDLARFVSLVDTSNGVAVRRSPAEWMFPNVDLTIHLHRQPEGRWVGLDTSVVFGAHGQGLTSTVLHDVHGPVGHCEQILTVRPLRG